jgi:cysteine desulfurase
MAHAPVYLDNHATTPLDPRVLDAMLPFLREDFGNAASSTHAWGWKAKAAVEQARRDVAAILGAPARDIVFTSGATESNNLAIRGVADATPPGRRRIVVSAIEHKSVLEVAEWLEHRGWTVVRVGVARDGRIDLGELEAAVTPETSLVSVMAANNEIGVVQPIADVAAIAKRAGALLHVDAAQAVGKITIDVNAVPADLIAFTAHKIHGPKGTGALYLRRNVAIEPQLVGGGHERGVRAGTLNVPGIVGLGAACAIARSEMATDVPRVAALRDRLRRGLEERAGGVVVNGSQEHRLPNNLHVTFEGVDGESLLIAIGDVAVSSGSACSSASGEPSHVLTAIFGSHVPSACIRFGLGRFTTDVEVDYAVERFSTVVQHLRKTAPAA